jgi:hypothetical protein
MRGKYHIYMWNWISKRCKLGTFTAKPCVW